MQAPSLKLPVHKTKIVCTIGPSSRSLSKLEGMIEGGMNVARLNFSHGEFKEHAENIRNIRAAAFKTRHMVSIFIDLPGVKIRIGRLQEGSLLLKAGDKVVLTTRNVLGKNGLIPVECKQFSKSVTKGQIIFLNDGFIQLKVERISGPDVFCKVLIGGKLLSHKGLNLPGAKLNINPITGKDLKIIDFGLKHGVNIFGLSFVEKSSDIIKVREFAKKKGHPVYLVAKIERRGAIENFDEILKAADAVMIARGDLGVEIPIEELPGVQKRLIQKANIMGRPVITATQMLESMTQNVRPTRAEVNDVANAILDGTDAVMLSEETAIGDYPVETVRMMAKIAKTTEYQRDKEQLSNDEGRQISNKVAQSSFLTITDVTSLNAFRAAQELDARYILTPTTSGSSARRISRFKPRCWILSFSAHPRICDFLNFSYGVHPFFLNKKITHDPHAIFKNLKKCHLVKKGDTLILTERRLSPHLGDTDSLGIVTL
jgi:pyruvate kinase